MNPLNNRKIALLCLVVLIVGSSLIQGNLDMNKKVNQTENVFLIDEGDGFSIQGKLDSKMEFSVELANKFAIRFLSSDAEEIKAVNDAVAVLQEAKKISEKYDASVQLDTDNQRLIGVLEKEEMNEDEKRELRRFISNLQNCNDQISHSNYNVVAKKSQNELSGLLAQFYESIFHIDSIELYQ